MWPDGTGLRPLRPAADTSVAEASPAWSPDGARVAGIRVARADGTARATIVPSAGEAWLPTGVR